MSEKRLVNAEEKLDCKKKYLYEYSMFWECSDGSKSQILENDVCDLLNKLSKENEQLKGEVENLQSNMMESLGKHRKYEKSLEEENKKLKAVLERKETLLKIRTEDNEKIMKSIQQLIIYLENSVYKSDVSAIAVKKDIISLIKKWEVR